MSPSMSVPARSANRIAAATIPTNSSRVITRGPRRRRPVPASGRRQAVQVAAGAFGAGATAGISAVSGSTGAAGLVAPAIVAVKVGSRQPMPASVSSPRSRPNASRSFIARILRAGRHRRQVRRSSIAPM